jgi:hypothetical protein
MFAGASLWISLLHVLLKPIYCFFHFYLSLLLEVILFYLISVRLSVMCRINLQRYFGDKRGGFCATHLSIFLLFNVLLNHRQRCTADRADETGVRPEGRQSTLEPTEFLSQQRAKLPFAATGIQWAQA